MLHFLKTKFYPYPQTLISMLKLAKFYSQKPETLQTKIDFCWKTDFLICLNSFEESCRLLIFFKKYHPTLFNDIEMRIAALFDLNSANSKL